jgi:hypothetical protein
MDAEAALAEVYSDQITRRAGARQLGAALLLGNTARVRSAFGPGVERVKPSRAYGDAAPRDAAREPARGRPAPSCTRSR